MQFTEFKEMNKLCSINMQMQPERRWLPVSFVEPWSAERGS